MMWFLQENYSLFLHFCRKYENTTTNTTTTDSTVQVQVEVIMKMPPWHEWYDKTALPLIML